MAFISFGGLIISVRSGNLFVLTIIKVLERALLNDKVNHNKWQRAFKKNQEANHIVSIMMNDMKSCPSMSLLLSCHSPTLLPSIWMGSFSLLSQFFNSDSLMASSQGELFEKMPF